MSISERELKQSTFDPTKVHPKFLVISCTADINYSTLVGSEFSEKPEKLTRGQDYLEFLHPGSFPVDESLDAIADVCKRFSVFKIIVISHTECGLVDACLKVSRDSELETLLFKNYADAVIGELEEHSVMKNDVAEMNLEQSTEMLSRFIAYRIAKHISTRLPECEIKAMASKSGSTITSTTIPWTNVQNVEFTA